MIKAMQAWLLCGCLCGLGMGCSDDTPEPAADGGGGSETDAGGKDEPKAPQEPQAKFFPTVTGTCPGFEDGDGCTKDATSLICTFQPANVEKPRKVRFWFDAEKNDADRMLVFFWHGLGGSAQNAVLVGGGLGQAIVDEIVDGGGIVASPEKEDGRMVGVATLPWLAALGAGAPDDFLVMDEVTACLDEKLGVDHRRIHSTGMSAGALQTGQVIVNRSSYVASAVMFSGGINGKPKEQDPTNKLPVAVFYGGPNDIVSPVKFEMEAMNARTWLDKTDHFSILCNHERQHTLPPTAAAAGLRFLKDHPFGTIPSPYAKGIPKDFPADYCEL